MASDPAELNERFNPRLSVRHKPGCAWHDGPQQAQAPAFLRGYWVRLYAVEDGATSRHGLVKVACDCGARAAFRDGRPVDDPLIEDGRSPSGPRAGDGLSLPTIRAALREWAFGWPPAQKELLAYSDRRIRQVLEDGHTTWGDELAAAEVDRKP